ncbi:hypothetical protein JTB14_026663 [Gonioctena quinquepunctata]|nr:hypothetical protein JTB14_026663 [Gonioctena quinquepunctata]
MDSTEDRRSYNNLEESPAVDETQEIEDSFDEMDTEVMEKSPSTASLSVKSSETGKRRKRKTVNEGTQKLLSEMTKLITEMTEI